LILLYRLSVLIPLLWFGVNKSTVFSRPMGFYNDTMQGGMRGPHPGGPMGPQGPMNMPPGQMGPPGPVMGGPGQMGPH
jgi:hypothetical protein